LFDRDKALQGEAYSDVPEVAGMKDYAFPSNVMALMDRVDIDVSGQLYVPLYYGS
jgi:hypothetical protein